MAGIQFGLGLTSDAAENKRKTRNKGKTGLGDDKYKGARGEPKESQVHVSLVRLVVIDIFRIIVTDGQ